MREPEEIVNAASAMLQQKKDMKGLRVLVTAGATRERLDPVRFLTNDSSGKMGFAIAEAARDRGAEVTVIKGSTTADAPAGIEYRTVESTLDLLEEMKKEAPVHDIIIQAAAPADYRPETVSPVKIKKNRGEALTLVLKENPDVAGTIGKMKKAGQTLIGFAAETDHVNEHAREKLKKKNLDMIVANDVTKPGAGFNTDTNIAALITTEEITERPLQSKRCLAEDILDKAMKIREKNGRKF